MIYILLVIAALAVYAVLVYNGLVTIKARILASIQEIGNQLKRQSDLIPNLMASAKGYLDHEKEIFENLTEARKMAMGAAESGSAQKMIDANQMLQTALTPIRAVFESTPQLRGVEASTKLMDELTDTADKVMYSRRTLIDLTADYNIKIATFPSNLIANLLGFKPEAGLSVPTEGEHLSVSAEEMKNPKVEL